MRTSLGQLNISCTAVDCKIKLTYCTIPDFSGFTLQMHLLTVHFVLKNTEKISSVCRMPGHKPALTSSYVNPSEIHKAAKRNRWGRISQSS